MARNKFILSFFLFCVSVFYATLHPVVGQDNYDVKFYWLDLKVSDSSTFISGKTRIDIEVLKNSADICLNMGQQLIVSDVFINGEIEDFIHRNDSLYVFKESFIGDSCYSIEVYYSGDANDSSEYGAMFSKLTDYGFLSYTLTEPFAAKYWFPCKEELNDKADSVYAYFTVSKNLKAGSNGILKKVVDIDEEHHQFQWESKYPVSFYLISVAVADYYDYTYYVDLNDTIQHMPVVNYIYNSEKFLQDNKDDIDAAADMLIAFSEMFGVYPFYKEKYGHCISFLGGGMEHQTMTTLGNFGFDLVSHEMAHQWFGDYVTCRYWNDIWINEGFASYAEYLAREKILGLQSASDWMSYTQATALEINDGSVYVPEFDVNNSGRIFDHRLSYKKGAAIIHMIRYELDNDSLFFSILKQYLMKFKFSTATGEDFRTVLEEFSGRSFEYFFNEWYYGEGYPVIQYGWHQKDDSVYIHVNQQTSSPDITPFFHLKLQFKFILPASDTIMEVEMNNKEDIYSIYMPSPVYEVIVDPYNNLLKKTVEFGASDSSETNRYPLLLFPNPVNDEINIFSRSIYHPVDLYVYNLIGKHIKTYTSINPSNTSIPMTDFEKGIYFFKINTGSASAMFKIIKQ